MINETELSELLWYVDLMGTCCAVNEEMEDEYEDEAHDIIERIAQGEDLRNAIITVFDEWFWKDCLLESNRKVRMLDRLMMEIESIRHCETKFVSLPKDEDTLKGNRKVRLNRLMLDIASIRHNEIKFENLPKDEDARILYEYSEYVDSLGLEAWYQKWVRGSIVAESLIFITADVAHLDEKALTELVAQIHLVRADSETTYKKSDNGFVFVNFNFKDMED